MAPQLCDLGGKKVARSQRSIAFGLEGRDGFCGLCREVAASGRDGGNGTRLQILDPGPGRVQPLPLLALLDDGDRQRLLGSVERPGSIAHLLVEDRQSILIGDYSPIATTGPRTSVTRVLNILAFIMNIVHNQI
jgi:hypothetical protein